MYLVTTWGCWNEDCDAGDTGTDWAQLDKAAERHVKQTGHPTWCRTRPQKPA